MTPSDRGRSAADLPLPPRRGSRSVGDLARLSRRFVNIARSDGFGPALGRARRKLRTLMRRFQSRLPGFGNGLPIALQRLEPHEAWRLRNQPNPRRSSRIAERVERLGRPTRFSILMPVFNPPEDALDEAVSSVVNQSYHDWELIVVDDASTKTHVRPLLRRWAGTDDRIRLIERAENGNISVATNAAADVASGAFFVLLDHDDRLDPDALAHLAIEIDEHPDDDLVYSDHDKIARDGAFFDPEFKPGWSPELLLSYCYMGHVKAIRASLYREVGGVRTGFEGSQDHDLLLRASERARRIGHVPRMLYHWRVVPGSTAAGGDEKPASFEAGRRAVEEAFHRRGVACRVEAAPWAKAVGSAVFRPIMPENGPRAAVLIWHDESGLPRLLESLKASSYSNFHVYILKANSEPLSLDSRNYDFDVTVVERDEHRPGAFRTQAAMGLREELLLFIDGRASLSAPSFLSQMVGWSRMAGVGAVGARVKDGKGSVLQAGLVLDPETAVARNAFEGLPEWDQGYLNLARVSRNASAVPASCLMTARDVFQDLGGFDAESFPGFLFDVDYCLRLRSKGLRCVVSAESELILPGPVADRAPSPREIALFRERHANGKDVLIRPCVDVLHPRSPIRPTVAPVGSAGPLRVLAVSHNLNWEGAPLIQYELCSALTRSSRALVVVVSPTDGPLRTLYENEGIVVEIRPDLDGVGDSFEALAQGVRKLADRLAGDDFDVLHANTIRTFWGVLAGQEAGVPSVWSVHESEPWNTAFSDLAPRVLHAALEAFAVPYRVVFASEGSRDVWSRLESTGNFDRIPTPLDEERFRSIEQGMTRVEARRRLGVAENEVCILTLGTVCERKGQRDLLEAFQKLDAEAAARVQCLVVGARESNRYSRDLEQRASELAADRRKRFRIFAETGDTASFWLAADLFCCTSRIESYPRVVLEAMARGLPIVTTPVFGIREQVRDHVNALFYEPGDVDGLAERLSRLIRDDRRRGELADQSPWVLRSLPSHSWFVDRYEALFQAAAESASPTSVVSRLSTKA